VKTLLSRFLGARSGASAIAQTMVTNIAVQGANVVSGILTARSLGPGGRGALASIVMWPQFLAFAMTLGIPPASVYWIKRRPDLGSELSGATLLLSGIFGALSAFAGFAIIPLSLHTYPREVIHMAQLWAMVTPLELFSTSVLCLVQVTGSFRNFNLVRFFVPFSVVATLLLERAFGVLNVYNAAAAYLLAGLPVTALITVWVCRYFKPSFKGLRVSTRFLLGYGVRAWGADLLTTVAGQIDRVLVVGLLNPELMGAYVVAQSAAALLNVLPTAVAPVALPKSSGLTNDEILSIVGRAVRVTLLVMVAAAIPLALLGKFLLRLVYGRQFDAAAGVLPLLIVEAVLDGLTSVLAQAFLASGFPGTVSLLQGCGLATSIPLLYFLIHSYGLVGAGAALMLATLCRFVLVLLNFPYRLKRRPPQMIISRSEFSAIFNRLRIPSSPV
jgi:O-antigen/teichoic acid export membrane protein